MRGDVVLCADNIDALVRSYCNGYEQTIRCALKVSVQFLSCNIQNGLRGQRAALMPPHAIGQDQQVSISAVENGYAVLLFVASPDVRTSRGVDVWGQLNVQNRQQHTGNH